MADRRRFELFARWIVDRFDAPRIFDVAGGSGRLNACLSALGREVTTFDRKPRRIEGLAYCERRFTLEEPRACDLVVGLHPDGATRIIVEYACAHGIPFAVVPCCSDNGLPYKPWMKHLRALAEALGARPEEDELPMGGRNRIIWSPGRATRA